MFKRLSTLDLFYVHLPTTPLTKMALPTVQGRAAATHTPLIAAREKLLSHLFGYYTYCYLSVSLN